MITIKRPPPPVEGRVVVSRLKYELSVNGEENMELLLDWEVPQLLHILSRRPVDANSPKFHVGNVQRQWFVRLFCGRLSLCHVSEPDVPEVPDVACFSYQTLSPEQDVIPAYSMEESLIQAQLHPPREIIFDENFQKLFSPSDFNRTFKFRISLRCQESNDPVLPKAKISSLLGVSDMISIKCQGRSWCVHKSLLAEHSDVFAACLDSGMLETETKVIRMSEEPPEVVEALLLFLYGHVGEVDQSILEPLLRLAHLYQIQPLVEWTSRSLTAYMCASNVHSLLELAAELSLAWLKDQCNLFLASHLSKDVAEEVKDKIS